MKNRQTNHLEINVGTSKFGRITFFIFIFGLVLISNVAISQTVPTVTSWTHSEAYSDPGTYEEIELNDAGDATFQVTLEGTDLDLVELRFESSGGRYTGKKIVAPALNADNTRAVYEVTAATEYTARVKYVPVDGICPPGMDAGDGRCWGDRIYVAGPGKHTVSATLVTPATNGETITVTDGVSTGASWNFWIVNTVRPNPPGTQPPPPINPPGTQPPPPINPPGTQPPVQQNNPPAFTDGDSTTRSVAENTASGTNIGSPVAATDVDNDTLTYTLGGTDAASFSIVNTSGQLQTSAALDYETKSSYTVTVSVSDGNDGTDSITVTINVTDVNENSAPVFTDGDSTTRSVAENTASGTNIGSPVAATDADKDTLTYTLGGTDAASFSIVNTSGQLQTSAALDYETKDSYSVTVSVSDGKGGTDSITVTISVTDVTENRAPVFTDGDSTTRSIAENTASGTNIGSPVAATDADKDTLTYTLGGTDAASFSIVNTSGQLQTSAALDYETKSAYTVTVSVSDGNDGTDSITVTINVTDVTENRAPVFTDGDSTTRSIAENTASGTNIGSPVAATDADKDTLTYTLGGTDAASFGIVSTSGQLQTSAALDYETKNSYTVTVSVSDGNGGTDSITVTINVTDVNEVPANNAPVFTDGDSTTRSIAENTASGTNIGSPIAATDADKDTLTYTLGGTDAASFSIVGTSGQLRTSAALDYETKNSYTVTVSVSDGNGGTDSITATITVTDVNETPANNAPIFTDGTSTTRSVSENTASGTNIGSPVAATDADDDTLTYTLGGTDAASFSIVDTSGQLRTSAALDYETKNSYTVTVSVSDGNGGTDSITVTITVTDVNETPANSAPVFTDGTSTTRSVAENTVSGTNIGAPVAATDADNDTLTYTLSGTDAASFSIVDTSGQLRTSAALDYETKTSYSVTVTVSDSSISTSIAVTINITDVDETVEPPPTPPADASTPPPSTPPVQPPTDNQISELVNHTVKPFDYEAEGVGKVVFSEWMLSTLNNMPQWIELYNTTNEDINLRGWQLVGRFMDGNDKIHIFKSHTINSLTVKAKQSSLIIVYSASVYRGSFSENLEGNVYSLRSTRQLWNGKGIVLELQDSRGNPIDRIGNLNEQDQVEWRIPSRTRDWGNSERRISLIRRLKSVKSRRYNFRFGVTEFGWFPADEVQKLTETKRSEYFYGMSSDVGTPGYRTEGADPLPVKLSSFIPQIAEGGQVVLRWTTASEVENAGFNVLRSESVAGSFTKINASLIQGAGTTSDRNEYTWIDTTAKPNIEYYYRIEDMSFDGISEVVATQRLKGIFTAGNRSLTRWAILKKATE